MMRLYINNSREFRYELETIARKFYWDLTVVDDGHPEESEGDYISVSVAKNEDNGSCKLKLTGRFKEETKEIRGQADCDTFGVQWSVCKMLYEMLAEETGKKPAFGILTGVRPVKYAEMLMREPNTDAATIENNLIQQLVSREKAHLIRVTAENGTKLKEKIKEKGYSLYVSIPFCPSRCSYCSFVSKSVERDRKLMTPYVDALCKELEESAKIAERLGLQLQTIYVGGGTPTVLEAEDLKKLTEAIDKYFGKPLDGEYCVEAGRPDTISEEKLRILKDAGVTRISINPQTGNDDVLEKIGRKHKAADIEWGFELARKVGFDNINADLIAGLPGDNLESFKRTIAWVKNILKPESVTVHALTLKRASRMREDTSELYSSDAQQMISWAQLELMAADYEPYYMYLQKGTVDGLENTGYAKKGFECLYNVFIMDELQTIIACGAGAVTKMVDGKRGHIERSFNMKYPAEYLDRFNEMLERKKSIVEFYEQLNKKDK